MNVIQVGESQKEQWNDYVYSLPQPHFYHDYRWREVIEKSFNHKTFYLMAFEDKKVAGVFPLVFMKSLFFKPCLVSLPFLNYGGIVADDKNVASTLLGRAVEISKEIKAAYIEMRHFSQEQSYPSPQPSPQRGEGRVRGELQQPILVTREHKVTMLLELSNSSEVQWAKLDKKVRNQIRKAEKSGLTAQQGKGELLDAFYKVFCRNMRDLGTPVFGKKFFENILKAFPEESSIFVIFHKDKPIAAAFTLKHHDIVEIPWASSIRDYDKLCPNMLLYWQVIKSAISSGCRQFDFGRCTKDSGTYQFKRQWNPVIHQLYWQYWADEESKLAVPNPRASRFSSSIWLWQKLPLYFANRLGPCMAQNIPYF